jgi:uncharacterized membrane protein YgcG
MLAVVALVGGASAAYAQYPPELAPTLVISQESGPPGFTFTATVTNCTPGQTVVFVLGDQRVEVVCTPVTLQATASLTAPPGPGSYTVTATVGGVVLTATIDVVAAPPSTLPDTGGDNGGGTDGGGTDGGGTGGGGADGGALPSTGSNGVATTVRTALILVVAGGGLFFVARARRRSAA